MLVFMVLLFLCILLMLNVDVFGKSICFVNFARMKWLLNFVWFFCMYVKFVCFKIMLCLCLFNL